MKHVLFIILILPFLYGQAQTLSSSVMNNAGWCSGGQGSISATHSVGEAIISTQSNSQLIITQGFLQPDTGFCDVTSIVDDPVWKQGGYTIFPNPAQDVIFVTGDLRGGEVLHLYDMTGQQVLVKRIQSGQNIDIQYLSTGVYMIQIIDQHKKRWTSFKLEKL